MATDIDRHINEATAEEYSRGMLSAATEAWVEEHLLICQKCRQSVTAADAYVAAIRAAAAFLRETAAEAQSPLTLGAGGAV